MKVNESYYEKYHRLWTTFHRQKSFVAFFFVNAYAAEKHF